MITWNAEKGKAALELQKARYIIAQDKVYYMFSIFVTEKGLNYHSFLQYDIGSGITLSNPFKPASRAITNNQIILNKEGREIIDHPELWPGPVLEALHKLNFRFPGVCIA